MTDQNTPAPTMAARAAEAASTAATVVVGLLPSLNTCLTLIVGGLVTWGGMAVKAHYEVPKAPIMAADPPKPVPMVAISDLDDVITAQCGKLGGKLDELLKRVPEVKAAPVGRKTSARVAR